MEIVMKWGHKSVIGSGDKPIDVINSSWPETRKILPKVTALFVNAIKGLSHRQ
jgi:hypothetical protein